MREEDREQFWALQYLRAFAAIIVVVGHAVQIIPLHGRGDLFLDFPIGGAGVDIFFIISGFIMCHIYASRQTGAGAFFKRRLARVGPAYWIVTIATSIALLIMPSLFRSSDFSVPLFLASMAFLAWPNPGLGGEAMPVFLIGWTLNYEFFFYGLFALAIAAIPARPWWGVSAIFGSCWLVGSIIDPLDSVAEFYLHPITAEFVAGMVIWRAHQHGLLRSAVLGWLGILLGLGLLFWVNMAVPVGRTDALRTLAWGGPGVLLVAGAVALDVSGRTPASPLWKLLGDASYAIYLIHFLVLGFVRLIWSRFTLKEHFGDLWLVAIALLISLIASLIFHLFIEKPASGWMRRVLQ